MTNDSLDTLTVTDQVVTGDTASIMAWTEQFKDYNELKNVSSIKRTDVNNRIRYKDDLSETYVVSDPDFGTIFRTKSPKKAHEWLTKSWDTYEDYQVIAAMKGAKMKALNGQYYLWQKGKTNPIVAHNLPELKKAVAKLPMPDYVGKDLLGLDMLSDEMKRHIRNYDVDTAPITEYTETVWRYIEEGKKLTFGKETDAKLSEMGNWFLNQFGPKDTSFKRYARASRMPEYYERLHALRRQYQQYEGLSYRAITNYKKLVGKLSPKENKRLHTVMLHAKDNDWAKSYLENFGEEISSDSLKVLSRTRELFSAYARPFGVDGWKFLSDYYPMIIEQVAKDGKNMTNLIPHEMAKRGIKAREIDFFAKNLRVGDAEITHAMNNLTDTVEYYLRHGMKTQVLGQAAEDTIEWINKNAEQLGTDAVSAANHYVARIQGIFDEKDITAFNKAMYRTTKKFFNDLNENGLIKKMMSESDLQNLLGFMNSVTISATMAYRPWPVMRNLFQPFNTTGLVVSQDLVMDAYQDALHNVTHRVERLKRKGILTDKNHMMTYTTDTAFRKFTDKGLHAYQSAHALNVAVTDACAELAIKRAWPEFAKTGDLDAFLKKSHLDAIPAQDRQIVLKALQDGNVEQAVDDFSEILIHQTQFPYKSHENPEAFQGLIGKLFGAYQHYPVYYTANLMKSVGTGPLSSRLERIFSTALTGAIAYGAMNYGLNINAKDFLFFTPISFSGGPLWSMGQNLLTMTSGGYEADIAFEKLKRDVPSLLIPGAGMATSVYDALKAAADGDYQTFFVKGLSAPLGNSGF